MSQRIMQLGTPTHFNPRPVILGGCCACGSGSMHHTRNRKDVDCLSCRRTRAFRKALNKTGSLVSKEQP